MCAWTLEGKSASRRFGNDDPASDELNVRLNLEVRRVLVALGVKEIESVGSRRGYKFHPGPGPYYQVGNGWFSSVPSRACLRRFPRSARIDLRERTTQAAAR